MPRRRGGDVWLQVFSGLALDLSPKPTGKNQQTNEPTNTQKAFLFCFVSAKEFVGNSENAAVAAWTAKDRKPKRVEENVREVSLGAAWP